MRKLKPLVLTTMLIAAGCHMFDDPDDVNPCPINDRYPCSCDRDVVNNMCADNSLCYSPTDEYTGMCLEPCSASDQCDYQGDFGLYGECIFTISNASYCAVVCDDGTFAADCPPGQICEWQTSIGLGICLPKAP